MTSARPRLKFVTAIIADDIRREDNGKDIYVGVYNDNMAVENTTDKEIILHLSISLIFEVSEIGEIPVHIEILSPGQSDNGSVVKGRVTINECPIAKATSSITLSRIPVVVSMSGNMVIRAKNYEEDEWRTVRILPVTVTQLTTETSTM